ncbi:OmpP1/FadL family transporter [Treponema pectinovorum]|uniref:OmpP1/FadL family transporter n=1 Tax=Treponema pectinovorum TaxID=164 RepID=UPI0011C6EE10|nr:hypothetical protein [Treponema pectinovorum]
MKKIFASAIFAAVFAGVVFAGGIDSKTNLSSGYLRNPSRNTESVRPEAALYNIAGTGFMADGLYLEVGNQFVFKNYWHNYNGSTTPLIANGAKFEDKENVFLYPNVEAVYKHGPFGFFATFQVAGGGGSLEYKDGTAVTKSLLYSGISAKLIAAGQPAATANAIAASIANAHDLKVYSVTYGENIGASYKLNDMFAFSAAVRLLQANQRMSLSSSAAAWSTVNGSSGETGYKASGFGIGGVFGVHAKPIEGLDVALQYKTITKMKVKINSTDGNLITGLGITEGKKFDSDMPAEINAGVGYLISNPLYINTSFNYYFNKQANIGSALSTTNSDYNNTWEWGGGVDYTITKTVLASTGVMYSKQGHNDKANNPFSPVLNCVNVGLGVEVTPIDDLKITVGGMYAKYFEEEYSSLKLNKSVFMFSLGATYRFAL